MMWEEYYSVLRELPDWLKKPAPFIVEAIPLFKKHEAQLILDLGCGVGRNLVYLGKEGFDVIGVDLSRSALKKTKVLSKSEGSHNVAVLRASMINLPFVRQVFHAVISVSVVHHALEKDVKKTIKEIHTVLREDGLFLANLLSIEDPRYGSGEKLEEGSFKVLDDFDEKQFMEIHHFFSKKEVKALLECFKRNNVEPIHAGKKEGVHRYWKIIAVK